MNQETLKATVQYQDLEGTAAADDHDKKWLKNLAEKHGIDTEDHFIIGVKIRVGETRDDRLGRVYVELLAVDMNLTKAGDIDHIRKYSEKNNGVLPYKTFSIETTLEDVLLYFKRFELVLFRKNLRDVKKFQDTIYD
jgi:hypothetical protein